MGRLPIPPSPRNTGALRLAIQRIELSRGRGREAVGEVAHGPVSVFTGLLQPVR